MLILETVVRVRCEHADGKSIKAIARDLRLSRKVVRKAIRAPEAGFVYQRTVQPLPGLAPSRSSWMRCWWRTGRDRGGSGCG